MRGGVSGSALEWAVALLRAPGERYALRLRSLPPGMETLLEVAADASTVALADISLRLGEPEDRVREAARFYVREVLFHPDADAYRTLGVGQQASSEQIKAHHRLLQHWLHPDRQRSEDDSVFAARVNTAWNELRNQTRRTAYDKTLREELAANPAHVHQATGPGLAGRRTSSWVQHEENVQPINRWRNRLPVLTLLGFCVLLGWLAIRDGQREPEAWDWKSGVSVAQVDAPDGDRSRVGSGRVAASVSVRPPAHSKPGPTVQASGKAATSPRAGIAPDKAVALAKPRRLPEAVTGPKPDSRRTTSVVVPSVVALMPTREQDRRARSIAPPAPAARPSQPPSKRVAVTGPPPARQVAQTTSPPPAKRVATASPPPASSPPISATAATASKSIKRKSPAVETAIASNGPPAARAKLAKARQPVGEAPARLSPPQVVAAVAPPSAPSAPSAPAPDFARIKQARQVGSQLLQYFRKIRQPAPPIWNSPAIMSSAGGMRNELHEQGVSRLDEPQWRINATSATMSTAFHADGEGAGMRGVLAVDMVWRENRWLVTGLSMEHGR